MRERPQVAGILAAQALVARAALGDGDPTPLYPAVDEIANGDTTRETLWALAEIGASVVHLLAAARGVPVVVVLDELAGAVVDTLNEATTKED